METQDERVDTINEGAGQQPQQVSAPEQAAIAASEATVDESVPPELRPGPDGKTPELTPKLLKTLRGKYFTVKHPFLIDCGHRLDMINEPRHRHCENCWFQWLNHHAKLCEVADELYRDKGPEALTSMRGKHFTKMFVRFMATLHQWLKEGKFIEPNNQEANGGTDVASNGGGTVVEQAIRFQTRAETEGESGQ